MLQAPVENPEAELARLNAEREQIENDATMPDERKQFWLLRHEWLTALSRVGALDAAKTTWGQSGARARLDELASSWQSQSQPKPLGAYDIPMQWFIVAAGFGGGLYIASLLFTASRRVYTYDPEKMALTLPNGGRTITPDDIKEVDKRKWDKFIVVLRLSDQSTVRLDLLRHAPLEEWVLEMEKQTEGYEPPVEEAEEARTPVAEPAAESQER